MASLDYSEGDSTSWDDAAQSGACPFCGKMAHQILATPRILANEGTEANALADDEGWFVAKGASVVAADWRNAAEADVMWDQHIANAVWQAALCAACKRVSVWREGTLMFPRTSRGVVAAHRDMPDAAATLFNEAGAVLDGSRRAAAALGRAALEALLKSVDDIGTKRDLNTRIGDLRERISPALWQVLTALRVVGNDALHSEDGELVALYLHDEDSELAETFLRAINELVEELITRPKRAEEIYAMLPESKREAAERAGSK